MKVHPAAEIFPAMSDSEYAALKADIDENGLIEPIVRYKKQILDGRHRFRACQELKIRPRFFDYDEDDPYGYVVSLNLHRRHLDESQRAMVAARLANMSEGRPTKTAQICAVSQQDAATKLSVSRRAVQHANKVVNEGVTELQDAVSTGDMTVSEASNVTQFSAPVQKRIAAEPDKKKRKALVETELQKRIREDLDESLGQGFKNRKSGLSLEEARFLESMRQALIAVTELCGDDPKGAAEKFLSLHRPHQDDMLRGRLDVAYRFIADCYRGWNWKETKNA